MKYLIVLNLLVMSCQSAEKTAQEKLGADVECIASSTELALCTLAHRTYVCDKNKCMYLPNAKAGVMLLEDDRQRAEQEEQDMAGAQ